MRILWKFENSQLMQKAGGTLLKAGSAPEVVEHPIISQQGIENSNVNPVLARKRPLANDSCCEASLYFSNTKHSWLSCNSLDVLMGR